MRSALSRVACVVVSALAASACSGQLLIDGAGADAGAEGGIHPTKDAGFTVPQFDSGPFSKPDATIPKDSGDPGEAGGGDCPAPITAMDIIEVHPPKDNTQGSCTNPELLKVTGKYSDILAAVSSTCAACLFSEANDMANSQFFVWADTMHVNVSLENFGACMGSSLSGGNAACGKAAEEVESCLEAACPRDGGGNTTCTNVTDSECVMAAVAGDCKIYDDKQTANCGGAVALKAIFGKCFDSKGSPDPGIKLLCGP